MIVKEVINSFYHDDLHRILDLINTIDVEELEADKFVYVAKEVQSGRFKIGISKNPDRRIKQLNTGNPEQLILVHAYLATEQKYQSEALAHSMFKDFRLKGEWFSSVDLKMLPSFINQ